MKNKTLIGLLTTIIIILIFSMIVGYFLITRSFPTLSGNIVLQGLKSEVTIMRDSFGVPYIDAQQDGDAFFAVGYVHAQDRLFQMELIRRAGSGRLSEIFGESTLNIDKMFRVLGFVKQSKLLLLSLDADTRSALQSYSDGVNEFIRTHKGKYPIEYDMLNIEPEEWTVENSLLLSRMMAWELNYSRWVDLLLAELIQKYGEEKAKEIFPYWQEDAPLIISAGIWKKNIAETLYPFFDAEGEYRKLFGFRSLESGSNAWVVSGLKTISGMPIIANDPHLNLMLPARWYEIHISYPTNIVSGMSLPGVPFVIIGRNQKIAWGVTNAMLDDCDYFIEHVDSIQYPTKYLFNNQWLPIKEEIDTILVKESLPVIFSSYHTHRGPIINKIEPNAKHMTTLISMKWVGYEISNEAGAFFKINKAVNWAEFQEALRTYYAPAQNFVYADVHGNIGYRTGGKIPIRKNKGPTLPFPGWVDNYDWKGFVPFEQMPQVFNPKEGFIATANNKIVDDSYPYHISNHYEPHWRIKRINNILSEQPKFSVEDIQRLQNDLVSVHAQEVTPLILQSFDSSYVPNSNVKIALEYFRNWNYEMRSEDVSTTLFQTFINKMIYNVFGNKMDDRLYRLYDTLSSVPLTALSRLFKNPKSEWFDDPQTPFKELRNDVIRKSMNDAVEYLQNELGGKLKEWQWGKLHTVTFKHVFGEDKLLASFFNVSKYAIGGSHSTVKVSQYSIANSFESVVGPSMRQIINLADQNDTRTVLPPGQSGQVFTKHYKDQVGLWLNGGYKIRPMTIEVIKSICKNKMILKPVR